MDQKYFRGVLQKYKSRRATPEEKELIDSWYAGMDKVGDDEFEKAEEPALERKYWAHIQRQIARNRSRSFTPWRSMSIAASLVIAVAAFFYLRVWGEGVEAMVAVKQAPQGREEIFNAGAKTMRVSLPDGSAVMLEPQSYLQYPSEFKSDERVVDLEGQAFFEIVRDETRPFLVHTNKLTTRVLGTSFSVKAFDEAEEVVVAVKTGKVAVYTNDERARNAENTHEIVLTPNQKIIYDKLEKKLSRMIVETPVAIIPFDEVRKLRFEAAPVNKIFEAIERVYGVEIDYDKEKFLSCTLTTAISDGGIFNRLDIICNAIGARYEIKENRIAIYGNGCNYH